MIKYIGLYFISVVSFLFLFMIYMNFKLKRKNKELVLFFPFLLIILSDILIKGIDFNIHSIILYLSFFLIATVIHKDAPKKFNDIIKYHKDIIYFVFTSFVIITIYILSKLAVISNNSLAISIFIYQLNAMFLFIFIIVSHYKNYPFKITFNIKFLTFLYLLTFILLIADYSFKISFAKYFQETPDYIAWLYGLFIALTVINYSLISMFGIIKLYDTENVFILQFIDLIKSKKNEFKILDIIQNIVLESEEFDSTLDNIISIACNLAKSDGGILYLYDKKTKEFYGKKVNGYVVPPFFVNEKILENREEITKKIVDNRISEDTPLFKAITESKEIVHIKRDADDEARNHLKYLRDYANNIGSVLAGKIIVDDELFGIIFLEIVYSNFAETDINIFKAVCNFSGVLIKNIESKMLEKESERLQNEMKIAEQIQTSMLPKDYQIPGFSISAFMKPADEVGGDYYDILKAPGGYYWVNIGDVTGHGVTAGLIMMMLQTSSLTAINAIPKITPKELAILCNKVIFDNVQNRLLLDQFITTCFLKFNKEGRFEYSGAHEDIMIYRKDKKAVEVIKTNGIWLGLIKDITPGTELNSFKLLKGDVLLLFTDGVIEIQNDKNEQYDLRRLNSFLRKNGEKEPDEISELLINELEEYKNIQRDDITYVILRKD